MTVACHAPAVRSRVTASGVRRNVAPHCHPSAAQGSRRGETAADSRLRRSLAGARDDGGRTAGLAPYKRIAPVRSLAASHRTACTVGPNYRRPKIELPADWLGAEKSPEGVPTTQASQTVRAAADVARWWTTLQDPVLDSLVERAIESNLDLRRGRRRFARLAPPWASRRRDSSPPRTSAAATATASPAPATPTSAGGPSRSPTARRSRRASAADRIAQRLVPDRPRCGLGNRRLRRHPA